MATRKAVNPKGTFLGGGPDKRVEFDLANKTLKVGGQTFRLMRQTMRKFPNEEHSSKDIFVAVNERSYMRRIDRLAGNIAKYVDSKDLLREVLRAVPMDRIAYVERMLEKKMPVKVIKGCYAIRIGIEEIQLVE